MQYRDVELYYQAKHRITLHQTLRCLLVLVETVCSEVKHIQRVALTIP